MTAKRTPWADQPPMRGVLWAVLFAAAVWLIIGGITLFVAGHL